MSPILVVIVFVILSYSLYNFATCKKSKFSAPGPIRFPFFGSYLLMLWTNWNYPHKVFQEYSRRYKSPVVSMYLGGFYYVIANDFDTCKEVFNNPAFQARPDVFPAQVRVDFKERAGIFFNDGHDWLLQRRYSMRELRDVGFGRRSEKFEGVVAEEVAGLIELIKTKNAKNEALVMPELFFPSMLNTMIHLLAGFRLTGDEMEKLTDFGKNAIEFSRSFDGTGRALSLFPWVRHIAPKYFRYNQFATYDKKMQNYTTEILTETKKTYDEEVLRGFIDCYIKDEKEISYFSDHQLRLMCTDIMTPPAIAIGTQMTDLCVYMALHPEMQEKCQAEIESVAGKGRMVDLNDRQYLPYTEAIIREAMRMETVAPLALPHWSTEDSILGGFFVPKESVVIANIHAMHHDEKLWGDPEVFRPERFLDARGNIKNKDHSLPFGLGKRVCTGETYARQNMFILFAALMQNFNVEKQDDIHLDKKHGGIILSYQDDFKMKLVSRY